MSTRDVYQDAINKWGENSQLDMAEEECAELIVELKKYRRGRNELSDVCGEIADVEVMMAQLRRMFDPTGHVVDGIKEAKLARLRRRIDGEQGYNG